jgi:hypothetical protein
MIFEPLGVSEEYPKQCYIITDIIYFCVITDILNILEFVLLLNLTAAASARMKRGLHREPRMIYARVNIICCSGRSHPSERSEALDLCLCLHVVFAVST